MDDRAGRAADPAGTSQISFRPIAYSAGCAASAELQRASQLLGEIAAHAVGEDRDLREDVGAGLERALLLAMPADALVAGAHADHAVAVEQHRLAGEAREEIDARGFDLPASHLVNLLSEMM